MHVVFDLDGVICDTHEAVKRAYRAAGVRMPHDAWGKPHHAWNVNPDQHLAKNEAYPRMLQEWAYPLGGSVICRQLREAGHEVEVLTGASAPAARAVLEFCNLADVPILGTEADESMKYTLLDFGEPHLGGIYIDDQVILVPSEWHFIKYTEHLETKDILAWIP